MFQGEGIIVHVSNGGVILGYNSWMRASSLLLSCCGKTIAIDIQIVTSIPSTGDLVQWDVVAECVQERKHSKLAGHRLTNQSGGYCV